MPEPVLRPPSQYESNQIARMKTMFAMSMKAQMGRRKQWRRNEQMVGTEHFAIFPNLDKDKSRVIYNMCFEVIQTILPILTDLLPKPEVKPKPAKIEGLNLNAMMAQAQKIEDGIAHQWDEAGGNENWPMWLLTSLIYGQTPVRALPEKTGAYMDIDSVDNFAFFLDGGGATSIKTSEWIITAVPIYISELIRIYGEKARGIKPTGSLENFRQFHLFPEQHRESGTGGGSVTTDTSGAATVVDLDRRANPGINKALGQVLLFDFWSRHMISGKPIEDEFVVSPVETYHHVTYAGDRVLVDKMSKNPIGRPPFAMIVNNPQDKSPWGMGESEQIETLNVAADVLLSEAVDAAVIGGNPPLTATSDLKGENPNGIKLGPRDTIWRPTRSSEVKWMETKQVSPALVGMPSMISEMVNTVSGVHDATAGRKPGGVTAASAIAKLQDAAAGRIRFKEKSSLRGPLVWLYTLIMEHIMTLDDSIAFIARDRGNGKPRIAKYGKEDFKDLKFKVKAGVPITENKVDLINLLVDLAQPLGLTPDELIELLPAEIRNLIQAVRNRSRDQGPFAGLDLDQLSNTELETLHGDDEDAIAKLLLSLTTRGLYTPPVQEELTAGQNGSASVATAT